MTLKKIFEWLKNRKAPSTILGLVLLTVVGSVVYDMLVRPGLSSATRFILSIITFGSATIRDSAYASAAMDPTPLTSLILLLAMVSGVVSLVIVSWMPRSRRRAAITALEDSLELVTTAEERQEVIRKPHAAYCRVYRSDIALRIFSTIGVLVIAVAFMVHNQSVLIWRTFHSNIAIVEPFLSREENVELRAWFASMNRRVDYQKIKKRLEAIATRNDVKLHDFTLW